MALSFEEQMELQDRIELNLGELDNTEDFEKQLTLQDAIEADLAKLEGKSAAPQTLYERLMAGEFINSRPLAFVDVLRDALKEIDNKLDMIKQPVLSYLEARQREMGVLESAPMTVAEALNNPEKLKALLLGARERYGDDVLFQVRG